MNKKLFVSLTAAILMAATAAGAASPGPQRAEGGDGNKRGVERPEFLEKAPSRQKSDIDRAIDVYKESPVKVFRKEDGSIGLYYERPIGSDRQKEAAPRSAGDVERQRPPMGGRHSEL